MHQGGNGIAQALIRRDSNVLRDQMELRHDVPGHGVVYTSRKF